MVRREGVPSRCASTAVASILQVLSNADLLPQGAEAAPAPPPPPGLEAEALWAADAGGPSAGPATGRITPRLQWSRLDDRGPPPPGAPASCPAPKGAGPLTAATPLPAIQTAKPPPWAWLADAAARCAEGGATAGRPAEASAPDVLGSGQGTGSQGLDNELGKEDREEDQHLEGRPELDRVANAVSAADPLATMRGQVLAALRATTPAATPAGLKEAAYAAVQLEAAQVGRLMHPLSLLPEAVGSSRCASAGRRGVVPSGARAAMLEQLRVVFCSHAFRDRDVQVAVARSTGSAAGRQRRGGGGADEQPCGAALFPRFEAYVLGRASPLSGCCRSATISFFDAVFGLALLCSCQDCQAPALLSTKLSEATRARIWGRWARLNGGLLPRPASPTSGPWMATDARLEPPEKLDARPLSVQPLGNGRAGTQQEGGCQEGQAQQEQPPDGAPVAPPEEPAQAADLVVPLQGQEVQAAEEEPGPAERPQLLREAARRSRGGSRPLRDVEPPRPPSGGRSSCTRPGTFGTARRLLGQCRTSGTRQQERRFVNSHAAVGRKLSPGHHRRDPIVAQANDSKGGLCVAGGDAVTLAVEPLAGRRIVTVTSACTGGQLSGGEAAGPEASAAVLRPGPGPQNAPGLWVLELAAGQEDVVLLRLFGSQPPRYLCVSHYRQWHVECAPGLAEGCTWRVERAPGGWPLMLKHMRTAKYLYAPSEDPFRGSVTLSTLRGEGSEWLVVPAEEHVVMPRVAPVLDAVQQALDVTGVDLGELLHDPLARDMRIPNEEEWEVVYGGPVRVRSATSDLASILHEKPPGTVVRGRQEGSWLELQGEPGFMRIVAASGVLLLERVVLLCADSLRAGLRRAGVNLELEACAVLMDVLAQDSQGLPKHSDLKAALRRHQEQRAEEDVSNLQASVHEEADCHEQWEQNRQLPLPFVPEGEGSGSQPTPGHLRNASYHSSATEVDEEEEEDAAYTLPATTWPTPKDLILADARPAETEALEGRFREAALRLEGLLAGQQGASCPGFEPTQDDRTAARGLYKQATAGGVGGAGSDLAALGASAGPAAEAALGGCGERPAMEQNAVLQEPLTPELPEPSPAPSPQISFPTTRGRLVPTPEDLVLTLPAARARPTRPAKPRSAGAKRSTWRVLEPTAHCRAGASEAYDFPSALLLREQGAAHSPEPRRPPSRPHTSMA